MLRCFTLLIGIVEVDSGFEELLLNDKLQIEELVLVVPREQFRVLIIHYLVKSADEN